MTDTRLLTQPHPTVEPAVVHRRHADTAFLADVHPDGTGGYVATALLPERHAYYAAHVAEPNRRLDPMLLLEACRQLVIYVAHNGLGLADDTQSLLTPARCPCRPTPMCTTRRRLDQADDARHRSGGPGRQPAPRVHVPVRAVTRWCADRINSHHLAGRVPGRLHTAAPPGSWRVAAALVRPTLPVPGQGGSPSAVGRLVPADVLLAEVRTDANETTARVLLPFDHLGLFDHRLDHAPGTLLVEAARQLGTALSPEPPAAVMTGLAGTFDTFVELDAPVHLVARPGTTDGERSVAVVQGGTVRAAINVATARASSTPVNARC